MNRNDILNEVKKFFDIDELVCGHILSRFNENAWQFLDTDYLHTLLIVRRDILKKPMYCNNHKAGTYQRGLRCNMCDLVRSKSYAYLSAHVLGKAGDFTVKDMTAEEARTAIKKAADLLPVNIRMEKGTSWLHIDVMPQTGVTDKVYEFKS